MRPAAKVFYMIAGSLSLMVGVVFLFLPVLPTVPFLALAAYCFAKVSERFYRLLRAIPWVGKYFEIPADPKARAARRRGVIIWSFVLMLIAAGCFVLLREHWGKLKGDQGRAGLPSSASSS